MTPTHGPVTTLIHSLAYIAQQYRRAKINDDLPRAFALRDAERVIAQAISRKLLEIQAAKDDCAALVREQEAGESKCNQV